MRQMLEALFLTASLAIAIHAVGVMINACLARSLLSLQRA